MCEHMLLKGIPFQKNNTEFTLDECFTFTADGCAAVFCFVLFFRTIVVRLLQQKSHIQNSVALIMLITREGKC